MKQNTASHSNRPTTRSFESEAPSATRIRTRVPLSLVPRLLVTEEELLAESLDHRCGFLVSQIDGTSTVETLLDVCGMTREEALGIFADLEARGIVTFAPKRSLPPLSDRLTWGWSDLQNK